MNGHSGKNVFTSYTRTLLCATALAIFALPAAQGEDASSELESEFDGFGRDDSAGTSFDDFERQIDADFSSYEEEITRDFEAFAQIVREETDSYKRRLAKRWPQSEISSSKVWVSYSEDLSSRTRVDFGKLTISLSHIGPARRSVRQRLKQLLTQDKAQAFAKDTIAQAVEQRSRQSIKHLQTDTVEASPILIPVITGKQKISERELARTLDAMLARRQDSLQKNALGETIYTTTVPLLVAAKPEARQPRQEPAPTPPRIARVDPTPAPTPTPAPAPTSGPPRPPPTPAPTKKPADKTPPIVTPQRRQARPDKSLPAAAKALAAPVTQYARQAKIDTALVFAVIETESAFNPMARSHVPAYGLMQIVPGSAGKDATAALFGKAKVLSPSYLYNSDNNIKIGTTYLNIVYFRYLKRIHDPKSRLYCSIAAYNTGAGNVAKAFIGSRNINRAAQTINQMSSAQVYRHLLERLPYEETRHYLERVNRRMNKY